MNRRSPYVASSLGHVILLAAIATLSLVQRPPSIVPSVRIVTLGGGPRAQKAKVAAKSPPVAAPVKPAPVPAPVPAPPKPKAEEKKKTPAPPERKPVKAAEKSGTQAPQKRDIVSKTTGQAPAVEVAPAKSPAEDTQAGIVAGTGGVGLETDADPGPLDGYLGLLRDKVAEAWAAPVTVSLRGEVRAVVYFVIERKGGAPQQLAIQVSSGDSGFDRSAMRAIYNAAPFAPLPASWGGDSIGIRFTFFQSY